MSSMPADPTAKLPRALRGSDLPLPPWDGWLQYDFMDFHLPTAVWGQVDRPGQSGNPPPPEGDHLAQIQRHSTAARKPQAVRVRPPDGLRTPAEAARKLRKPRRPSISKMIAQAEKAGKPVTSITTPDGMTLRFGEPEPGALENPWFADLDKAKQQ